MSAEDPHTLPAPLIVGYTLAKRTDADEGLQLADFGYIRPETNAKYLADFLRDMHTFRLLGHITRIVAADPWHEAVMDTSNYQLPAKEEPFKSPAHAFAYWLSGAWSNAFPHRMGRGQTRGVEFFGFELKPLLRILGAECVDAQFPLPLSLYYANDEIYDPYDMQVEAEHRKQIPLAKVLRRVGMRLTEDYRYHVDPLADTILAAEMIYRFNVIPDPRMPAIIAKLRQSVAATATTEEAPLVPAVQDPATKPAKKAKSKAH
jgi:hypothetical protein